MCRQEFSTCKTGAAKVNTLVSIKEIMFCLDEYAVVDEKATILDALWSLEKAG